MAICVIAYMTHKQTDGNTGNGFTVMHGGAPRQFSDHVAGDKFTDTKSMGLEIT